MFSQTRNTYIQARLTPDERRALELIARQERRQLSETLRELIRNEAKRRDLWPPNLERVKRALGDGEATG